MEESSVAGTTGRAGQGEGADALILLGCPQVPVQTSAALYLAHALSRAGIRPRIAGTPAARKLVEVADPERHYAADLADLDGCIGEMAEGRGGYRYCFAFIHNDSGVAYAATVAAISQAHIVAVLFGEHAEALAGEIEFPCERIVAPAPHNPLPLKRRIDEVLTWVASNQ
ncbi:MAG: DUF1890 domain-containing protein [Methanomicrobiaceae archaeon]|nr:DUF1890 domain-containing protein [Methanomicrobiaceae archaeon]MDD5420499.1 DUF1890 domain-containing protein [Methanomicrobiaceae archaeon]